MRKQYHRHLKQILEDKIIQKWEAMVEEIEPQKNGREKWKYFQSSNLMKYFEADQTI